MDADELFRSFGCFCQPGNRQRRGIRRKDRVIINNRLGLSSDVRLDSNILENGFDDEFATRQVFIIVGRRNSFQDVGSFVRIHAPTINSFLQKLSGIVLALLCIVFRHIEQNYLHSRIRRHIGNTRAHHAGTQDAQLCHRAFFRPFGTTYQLVRSAFIQEQCPRHVA